MLRVAFAGACRVVARQLLQTTTSAISSTNVITKLPQATVSILQTNPLSTLTTANAQFLSKNPAILQISAAQLLQQQQQRSVTKFSLKKGKRKTVKAVLKRFKRLDWGGWIRTRAGRQKKLWKKSIALKKRLRQHVFVNSSQAWLLDKMVTKYWRKPKYYVDDPYRPYHSREEYRATRKNPLRYD